MNDENTGGASSNQQTVIGDKNQTAGRDIHNHQKSFSPNPANPNLMVCKYCEFPGLCVDADECPECGHNYERDRILEFQEAQAIRSRKIETIVISAVILFFSAFFLYRYMFF